MARRPIGRGKFGHCAETSLRGHRWCAAADVTRQIQSETTGRVPTNGRNSDMGPPHSTTSRTEWHARISRQRRGVRQPHAAFKARVRANRSVHWLHSTRYWSLDSPCVGPTTCVKYLDKNWHLSAHSFKPSVTMFTISVAARSMSNTIELTRLTR